MLLLVLEVLLPGCAVVGAWVGVISRSVGWLVGLGGELGEDSAVR